MGVRKLTAAGPVEKRGKANSSSSSSAGRSIEVPLVGVTTEGGAISMSRSRCGMDVVVVGGGGEGDVEERRSARRTLEAHNLLVIDGSESEGYEDLPFCIGEVKHFWSLTIM